MGKSLVNKPKGYIFVCKKCYKEYDNASDALCCCLVKKEVGN